MRLAISRGGSCKKEKGSGHVIPGKTLTNDGMDLKAKHHKQKREGEEVRKHWMVSGFKEQSTLLGDGDVSRPNHVGFGEQRVLFGRGRGGFINARPHVTKRSHPDLWKLLGDGERGRGPAKRRFVRGPMRGGNPSR